MKFNKLNSILFLSIIFCGSVMLSACSNLNNDKLLLMPEKDDPTISFRIMFKTGAVNDPQGKEGLAALTAAMMADGATKTNSYQQILEKLYPIASSYNVKVDKEMTVFYGRTHKDNIQLFYKLFKESILQPAFNEEDFQRIKSHTINYIKNELRYSSDEELAKAALYQSIFEGTSYAHLTEGTVESVNSITLDDVKAFYSANFTKNNFVIGIGGGYDSKLPNQVFTDLSTLPDVKVTPFTKVQPKAIDGLNMTIIEKNIDATAISLGFPIPVLRGDDDFFALALFSSWFGEHRNSSSHLYQVIREKRGLNYGDYSYVEAFLNGGELDVPEPNNARHNQIFEMWLRPVKEENRHFVLRAALRELQMAVDSGMKKEDFELTKKFLHKYALNYAQTTMMRLGYQLDSKFYGIKDGGDYIEYFRKKIDALTLDQVNAAIKKYLNYKNIKIAVVTSNAEDFKDALVKDSPSPIKYVSPVGDKVLTEDKVIEIYPLKFLADKIKIVKVDEMFEK